MRWEGVIEVGPKRIRLLRLAGWWGGRTVTIEMRAFGRGSVWNVS